MSRESAPGRIMFITSATPGVYGLTLLRTALLATSCTAGSRVVVMVYEPDWIVSKSSPLSAR